MTAYELNNRLKNYNLTAEIAKAMKMTKDKMADKNREQLKRGRNTINNRIQPRYKSKNDAKKKSARNSRPGFGVPDLNDLGDFHKAIDVKITVKQYEFINSDIKAPMLIDKYPLILGMSAKSTEEYSKDTLLPILKANLKKRISK